MTLAVVVGDVINDIVVRPHAATATGSDTPAAIEPRPGGSGANLAAWMGALGGAVRFVGRAGAADASMHRAALSAWGVDARISVDAARPTGTIVVQVGPDGERSMFTDRGASTRLDGRDLDVAVLTGASLLHLSGYCLFEPDSRAAALDLWAAAGDAGLVRTIDPSSVAGLASVGAAAFVAWTAGASVIFPNLDEGRLLTGATSPAEVVGALLAWYPTVALKVGPDGVVVGSSGVGTGVDVVHRSAARVTALDTTGAGDAFAAGYLTAALGGAGVIEAADAGLAASARAVTAVGGRPGDQAT